jgi:hypothetical protein
MLVQRRQWERQREYQQRQRQHQQQASWWLLPLPASSLQLEQRWLQGLRPRHASLHRLLVTSWLLLLLRLPH